jgi:hypothetical protein
MIDKVYRTQAKQKKRLILGCLFLMCALNSASLNANDEPAVGAIEDYKSIYYCDYPLWYDDWYCNFNKELDETVNSLNRWFYVKTKQPTPTPAVASGKIRLGWEPRSGDLNQFDTRFKIRVKLPALKDRVELLFTDEEDDINQQPVKAARNRELGNQEETTVAIQFKDDVKSPMSYRVGFGRGGQLYTRARYSEGQNYGTDGKLAYFSELHYYSGDKFGAELNARYTHTFSETQALEFSNSFRYRDKRKDWFWRHELKYLHMLDANQSLLFTAMIDGLSKPSYRSEQRLLSVRYKRNILRPWLFVEVEPFMLWLREEDFRTSYGLALRLEVHFPDKSLLY